MVYSVRLCRMYSTVLQEWDYGIFSLYIFVGGSGVLSVLDSILMLNLFKIHL